MYINGHLIRDEHISAIGPIRLGIVYDDPPLKRREYNNEPRFPEPVQVYEFVIMCSNLQFPITIQSERLTLDSDNDSIIRYQFTQLHTSVLNQAAKIFDDEQYLEEHVNRKPAQQS